MQLTQVVSIRPILTVVFPGSGISIQIGCPHWIEQHKVAFNRLRKLYFSRQVNNFFVVPTTTLYKHITMKSPFSKIQLLAHLGSIWDNKDKIVSLKDHEINVIVGYYLTENMNDQILEFTQHLQECGRHIPFSASVLIARQFIVWARYRDHAATIIGRGLNTVRDDLVRELKKVTTFDEDMFEETRDIMSHASPDTYYLLPRAIIHQKLVETFPGDVTDFDDNANDIILDDSIYTRLLTWLDVLATIPDPSGEQKYSPSWTPEIIVQNFFADTALDGPLKWLTKKCGHELGLGIVDELMVRTELRAVGRTLRDIVGVFAFYTQVNWELQSSSGESRLSQQVMERCDVS
jgi:hypothetical protein